VDVGKNERALCENGAKGVANFGLFVYWQFILIVGLHVFRHTKRRFEVAFAWLWVTTGWLDENDVMTAWDLWFNGLRGEAGFLTFVVYLRCL
jgi:hypothetical protein